MCLPDVLKTQTSIVSIPENYRLRNSAIVFDQSGMCVVIMVRTHTKAPTQWYNLDARTSYRIRTMGNTWDDGIRC
jgi:hypothetical protein